MGFGEGGRFYFSLGFVVGGVYIYDRGGVFRSIRGGVEVEFGVCFIAVLWVG